MNLAQQHDAAQVLLLGADVCSLPADGDSRDGGQDRGRARPDVPAYSLGPHDGLGHFGAAVSVDTGAVRGEYSIPVADGRGDVAPDGGANGIGGPATGCRRNRMRCFGRSPKLQSAGFSVRQVDCGAPIPPAPGSLRLQYAVCERRGGHLCGYRSEGAVLATVTRAGGYDA